MMIEKILERLEEKRADAVDKWDGGASLKAYSKAIEIVQKVAKDGGWVHLPCKVGDTVYRLTASKNAYYKTKVSRITIYKDSIWVHFFNGKGVSIKEIGKIVFLTETGAEEALAKMGE